MARPITTDISQGVKHLITHISGFEEGTEIFEHIQKYILSEIKKSDTMYFLTKREVDDNIVGMADKFNFHGFFQQAKALKDAYNCYVPDNLQESMLINRLNIVKFLLCMSEMPTAKFLQNPEEFEIVEEKEEEEINWAEYLNEGIEKWSPNYDSSELSDISSCLDLEDVTEIHDDRKFIHSTIPFQIETSNKDVVVTLKTNREELLNTIQHTWYNQGVYHDKPFSGTREANIGILWENFLETESMGLIPFSRASVLSEYKVIREICWQLWSPHSSAVFEYQGDNFTIKHNVTISSVRSVSFEDFIRKSFIPHILVLDFFRTFSKSLAVPSDSADLVPRTYRSYNSSLQSIIRPIYRKISELEDLVREQETTYTLLNLADDLQTVLEPVHLLKKIHDEIVIDFTIQTNLMCSLTLLIRLYNSLFCSVTKLEQDLKITLFLDSLRHYFSLVDAWLLKGDLSDYSKEFLIINKNKSGYNNALVGDLESSDSEPDICKLNFDLSEDLDNNFKENGIIKIMSENVLQIGRNLHLLRLLGKFLSINDSKETIYQEFVRRILEELCRFFNTDLKEVNTECADNELSNTEEIQYKYPVVCTEQCKKPTEMDKLENLVDTTDGFLMLAFQDYFVQKPEAPKRTELTLFEKISKITTTFFPIKDFFENIFRDILKERFTRSGLMVKNLLIEQYLLEKQFQFLRHLFMFFDDLIFPFYKGLFERISASNGNWGNDVWLTFQLQDIIMDLYPEFYEKCLVHVDDNWRLYHKPSEACSMISLQYEIQWPLNIIISSIQMDLYKDIFQFILKMKWALYTLNHLSFTDLEPKMKKYHKIKCKTHRTTIMKLKYLKFSLTNVLNSIQHFIFSFIFTKNLQLFENDFEKSSDLTSIIVSHSEFIGNVSKMIMTIRIAGKDFSAFNDIASCVKKLKSMWSNIETATPDHLYECYNSFKGSYDAIIPIIYPVYIFDY